VSGDGSVVVGQSDTGTPGTIHAFRWTKADGMVDLGTLGGPLSIASSTDKDGSVIVGCSTVANDTKYWDGFQVMGCRPNAFGAKSPDVRAFRWTAATGIKDLNTLVSDAGEKMSVITMVAASAVSENGFIVGYTTEKRAMDKAIYVRGFRLRI
jgi:probable HAF family extracellular repeat protein